MAKTRKQWTVQTDGGGTETIEATSLAQAEAISRLRRWLKPGDKVWTVLRHRSASGMSRVIGLVMPAASARAGEDDRMLHLDYNAAVALGWRHDNRKEGVNVGGCGMDMGFHLVYELSRVLFGDGYALKQGWI